MKKYLLLLLVALPFIFSSCSKDDDPKEEKFSVVGKTFATHAYDVSLTGDKVFWVFRFKENGILEQSARKGSHKGEIIGEISKGTYILEYPTITIKIENKEIKEYKGTFVDEFLFKMDYGILKNLSFVKQDD